MHSVTQNADVKIYVVLKFKRHIIKSYYNMFRITKYPPSGSDDLYFECSYLVGVWQLCRQTLTTHMINICEPLQVTALKVQVITP